MLQLGKSKNSACSSRVKPKILRFEAGKYMKFYIFKVGKPKNVMFSSWENT